MKIDIVSVLPGLIEETMKFGVIGRALEQQLFELNNHDLRDYTEDKHRQVDDYSFGGGSGMVLKCEPLFKAADILETPESKVILMTPQGKLFSDQISQDLSREKHLIIFCGRYEGVDERFRKSKVDLEISIGDYILSGGELAAVVVLDSILRNIPGVLNSRESIENESFRNNLLDYPVYTRPREFLGMEVPQVLLSGNHKEIEKWREKMAVTRTKSRRPDLWEKYLDNEKDKG